MAIFPSRTHGLLYALRYQASSDIQKTESEKRMALDYEQQKNLAQMNDLEDFVQTTDEMTAALTQFRNRRDYEKKSLIVEESFERVLDEDTIPKTQKILKIVSEMDELLSHDLLRQARALFPDDSDLVLVLREMLRRYKFDEIKRQRIQEVLLQIEEQANPRALRAGINCALKAKLFGKMLSLSPTLLRASYRNFLENDAGEMAIYEEWIASYGYQRRSFILDFVETALLTDVDAQDPSCSSLEFGHLLSKLTQLKVLRSADISFIKKLLADVQVSSHNNSEAAWLVFMLAILHTPEALDALLYDVLGEAIFLSSHQKRAQLLQAIRRACKSLPLSLFSDDAAAFALLEHFDHLVGIAYHHEISNQRQIKSVG